MIEIDETKYLRRAADEYLVGCKVVGEALCELMPDITVEAAIGFASCILTRLAKHRPPLLIAMVDPNEPECPLCGKEM